jgi:DNA-binding protein HU-beta
MHETAFGDLPNARLLNASGMDMFSGYLNRCDSTLAASIRTILVLCESFVFPCLSLFLLTFYWVFLASSQVRWYNGAPLAPTHSGAFDSNARICGDCVSREAVVPLAIFLVVTLIPEFTMNKAELIDAIAEGAAISKADAGRALDATIAAVTKALKNGDTVSVIGFGSFVVRSRAARVGRNPKTREEIQIPASNNPTFKAGKALKDAVN